MKNNKVELLAPVGSMEAFQAGLQAGADAFYLGSGRFNARAEKAQMSREELVSILSQAHAKKKKVYLTLNILFHDHELSEAMDLAEFAYENKIDAVIVQDRGFMKLLQERLPLLEIHASTQCTASSKEALLSYRALGCSRVVLPRELSLEEISELRQYADSIGLECEVFIHGALCMSVSGQCHMSHYMGGRSANRGDCAQSCRMQYTILRNGDLFRKSAAWLSPKDIGAFRMLDKLLETGVHSLKIEGRLRRPEYVQEVCSIYRQAIDDLYREKKPEDVLGQYEEERLLSAFNRGGSFHQDFFMNTRSSNSLSQDRTGHMGVKLGTLFSIEANQGSIIVKKDSNLSNDYLPGANSQISLRTPSNVDIATAPCGVIEEIPNQRILLKGFHPRILRELAMPLDVYVVNYVAQNTSPEANALENKTPIQLILSESKEHYLQLKITDGRKVHVVTESTADGPVFRTDTPIPEERVKEQLAKLGNSPYTANRIDIKCPVFRKIKDLNALRRSATEEFHQLPDSEEESPKEHFTVEDARNILYSSVSRTSTKMFSSTLAIVFLPYWKSNRMAPALLRKPIQLIIPAMDFLQAEVFNLKTFIRHLHPESKLYLLFPPLSIEDLNQTLRLEENRERLKLVDGFAQASSGLPLAISSLDLTHASTLSWEGNQLWNAKTWTSLREEGYEELLLSPELSLEDSRNVLQNIPPKEHARAILWAYGRTTSMFTRFCPIGFSQGKKGCSLCEEAHFDFEDNKGRVFPLRPYKNLDCSFAVMQSEVLDRLADFKELVVEYPLLRPAYVFTNETSEEIDAILRV